MLSRNTLQQFTFGVLGGSGPAQADGGGIRLRGGREQTKDLGGTVDTEFVVGLPDTQPGMWFIPK